MKEGVDFIKIKDYAVINLNNMIPVPDSQIVDIDINKKMQVTGIYFKLKAVKSTGKRTVSAKMLRLYTATKSIMEFQHHSPKEQMIFELLEKLCKEY